MKGKTEGVRKLWDKYKYVGLIVLIGVGLLLWPSGRQTTATTDSRPASAPAAEPQDLQAEMEEILDTIPADASVNCSTFLLAHIADREEIYELAYHGNKPDVDYVVIDARYSGWEKYRAAYQAHGYSVVSSGLIVVMKR